MNGWNRSSATAMSCPTASGVGIDMATSARRPRGRRTPSVGSEPITRSFTAARNTDLTLTYRVLIVPGARPVAFICLIQVSTSERRTGFMGVPANGTDLAASDIASTLPGAQTWRADHSPKKAEKVIRPACGSAYVPVTTVEVT